MLPLTVPLPEPDAPETTVRKSELLTAVHMHPAGAVTFVSKLPAKDANVFFGWNYRNRKFRDFHYQHPHDSAPGVPIRDEATGGYLARSSARRFARRSLATSAYRRHAAVSISGSAPSAGAASCSRRSLRRHRSDASG